MHHLKRTEKCGSSVWLCYFTLSTMYVYLLEENIKVLCLFAKYFASRQKGHKTLPLGGFASLREFAARWRWCCESFVGSHPITQLIATEQFPPRLRARCLPETPGARHRAPFCIFPGFKPSCLPRISSYPKPRPTVLSQDSKDPAIWLSWLWLSWPQINRTPANYCKSKEIIKSLIFLCLEYIFCVNKFYVLF